METNFSGQKDVYATGGTRDAATDKGRFDLISVHAETRVAQVYERGGKNHGDRNWENGFPMSRALSSAKRHLNQAINGERDEDHLAQAMWNIMCAIHFEQTGRQDLDDRPFPFFAKEPPPGWAPMDIPRKNAVRTPAGLPVAPEAVAAAPQPATPEGPPSRFAAAAAGRSAPEKARREREPGEDR